MQKRKDGPIRVALAARMLNAGGSERQLVEVAKKLDRSRFEPHVLYYLPGTRLDELRQAGVRLEEFSVTSYKSPSFVGQFWRMGQYFRRENIDIVHTFDQPTVCSITPVARWSGVPVVLTSQRAHRELTPKSWLPIQRWTDRTADGVVANCEMLRRHLIDDEKVAAEKISVCYNGLNAGQFPFKPRQPKGSFTIGSLCVLRPEKDLLTLVRAFARVHDKWPNTQLLLVGSGPEKDALLAEGRALGIADAMQMEPSTNKVAEMMHRMDTFVLPSISEALSNSIMEAMACGTPVVASRVGGTPELITEGETGLLFGARDVEGLAGALEKMISNQEFRDACALRASQKIHQHFTLEASVRSMEQIYLRHLEKAGRI